jgi:hypothetical protein
MNTYLLYYILSVLISFLMCCHIGKIDKEPIHTWNLKDWGGVAIVTILSPMGISIWLYIVIWPALIKERRLKMPSQQYY